jgi:hypothetical protein
MCSALTHAFGGKATAIAFFGMSALGQKWTFVGLLDQLVGACEQWQGYRQAERAKGHACFAPESGHQ